MPDTLKPKQKRTPKQYEAIEKGALSLSLEEMVSLSKVLADAIKGILDYRQVKLLEAKEDFDRAKALLNGDKE